MERKRIGNDLRVIWSITRNGQEEPLEGRNIKVSIIRRLDGTSVPFTYHFVDNKVVGDFYGKDQTATGEYVLLLTENEGEVGMHTIDHAQAFVLVSSSSMNGHDEETCSNIEIETIELEDSLDYAKDGLSAYEIAVLYGYEGTEEEWITWLEDGTIKADEALEKIANETMPVYQDGGYNMDECVRYGHYFACGSGTLPEGHVGGESYDLDVVLTGARDEYVPLPDPENHTNEVKNVIGGEGWDGTFGYYNIPVPQGEERFVERYYGSYPSANEEICSQVIHGLPNGKYSIAFQALGCSTVDRDSWLSPPDLVSKAFEVRANGYVVPVNDGSVPHSLRQIAVTSMDDVYTLSSAEIIVANGTLDLRLYAGASNTANWFILRCISLFRVTDALKNYAVVKQTCHSSIDTQRIFQRFVLVNQSGAASSLSPWERLASDTEDIEEEVSGLNNEVTRIGNEFEEFLSNEATVEDVENLE